MNAEPGQYFRLVAAFPSDGDTQKRVSLIFKLYADYGYLYFSKNKYHFQMNVLSRKKFELRINKRPVITLL